MRSTLFPGSTGRFFPTELLFVILLFFTSCAKYQDVQYKGTYNIRVAGMEQGAIRLTGEARFFNPNPRKIKLRGGEIEIFVDDRKTATVIPSDKVTIGPNSDFSIPLEARVETRGSDLLKNILGAIGGRSMNVRYEGYIKVSSGLVFSRIKISDEQKVRM